MTLKTLSNDTARLGRDLTCTLRPAPFPTHRTFKHHAIRVCAPRAPLRQLSTLTSSTAAVTPSVNDEQLADENPEFSYGQAALQGPRDTMEDFTSVIPDGRCGFLIASLFDGHSGPRAAEWLNTRLYESFSDTINEDIIDNKAEDGECEIEGLDEVTGLCCPVGLRELLADSFEKADKLLLDELRELEDEDDRIAGSTATVAMVRGDKIIVANVGDSRAVLCRQGMPVDLTTEHRVYGDSPVVAKEIARVEEAGGWVADGRVCDVIAVSRAFGDIQFKEAQGRKDMLDQGVEYGQWEQDFVDTVDFKSSPVLAAPDVTEIPLKDLDEFLVIASDGLWDVMSSKDVIHFARTSFQKKADAQQVADKLTKVAIQRRTEDNVAVIVVDLGGPPGGWGGGGAKKPGLFSRVFGK
mmetsp:Transcript_15246/g.46030  ORF Transcript_15246/g.46030 Transcript_15246/m.46030 type:complete len:410 (+) Transcript_15246:141-1370(+)|eukprot:CAMPEP_0206135130 /NCGR_PEP_ID=MMETSP1473-20131121/488_1 /ASSEMBLY_ACC=CAM_ASM_001109 /TAXON_ID=1461547 /ORGANISM="Stichococcus sp, Strain RCC1054" /LENGTH=409 /DNA_ID=CAMNT_0053526875 /DNA_START=135 /DNA_END=1364 /DNA_ORIENTATION=-